jgi:hypothetical protein
MSDRPQDREAFCADMEAGANVVSLPLCVVKYLPKQC